MNSAQVKPFSSPLILANTFTFKLLRREFARRKLRPQIVMVANDETTIKAYVSQGIGISLIPAIFFDGKIDRGLGSIDVQHCCDWTPTVYAGFRKNSYIPDHVYDFALLISPRLTRKAIDKAVYDATASA